MFMDEMKRSVVVRENGQKKKIPMEQALAKVIFGKAMAGDARMIRLMLELRREIELSDGFYEPVQVIVSKDDAKL